MSFTRILKTVLVIVGVAVLAVVLYLQFADFNKHRPRIEAAVTDATGRDFRINGDLEVDVLPSPRVSVEGVTLANAEWGSEPLMVEIGHLSAEVGLWSLLFGPIDVHEFRLHDVRALLEADAEGAGNWEMGPPEEAPPPEPAEEEAGLPVVIRFAELRNLTLTYRQPETDDQQVTIAELTIQPDGAGNLGLTGTGTVLGLPLGLQGQVGPEAELEDLGAIEFGVGGNLGSLAYQLDGRTEDLEAMTGTTLKAELSTEAVEELLEAVGAESPLAGPLRVAAELAQGEESTNLKVDATLSEVETKADTTFAGESVSFEVSVATLDKLGELLEIEGLPAQTLTASGAAVMGAEAIGISELVAKLASAEARVQGTLATGEGTSELTVDAKGNSLAELSADMPEIPFTLGTTARLSPEQLALSPLSATFGESDIAGEITLGTGETPDVDVTIRSNLIDLTPFVTKEEGEEAPEAEEAPAEEPESEYVFSEEPFDFSAIQAIDADVEATIGRFVMATMEVIDLRNTTTLHDGTLKVQHSSSTPGGGTSETDLMFKATGNVADLVLLTTLKDLKLNIASGETVDVALIPETSVTLDISATGASPRAMASSTDGRLLLTQGPGRVENKLVGRFSGDVIAQVFGAINPFSKQEEYSNWECSVFAIDFVDGLGEISGFLLQGEKLMVVGGGKIDLNTEELKIEFNTKPRKGVGVSADMFVTPFVELTGTLASPSVGLNKKGVLLSGGAAVLTGGLSFLYQGMADRATGGGDMCEKTLAEVGGHGAAGAAPAEQSAEPAPVESQEN